MALLATGPKLFLDTFVGAVLVLGDDEPFEPVRVVHGAVPPFLLCVTTNALGRRRRRVCRRAARESVPAGADRHSSTRRSRSGRPARGGSSACREGSASHRRTATQANPARATARPAGGGSPRCTQCQPSRRI